MRTHRHNFADSGSKCYRGRRSGFGFASRSRKWTRECGDNSIYKRADCHDKYSGICSSIHTYHQYHHWQSITMLLSSALCSITFGVFLDFPHGAFGSPTPEPPTISADIVLPVPRSSMINNKKNSILPRPDPIQYSKTSTQLKVDYFEDGPARGELWSYCMEIHLASIFILI